MAATSFSSVTFQPHALATEFGAIHLSVVEQANREFGTLIFADLH